MVFEKASIEIPVTDSFLEQFGDRSSKFEVKLKTEICLKIDKQTGDFIELVFPANIDNIQFKI